MIARELKILFTAIMFFTRIPCPKWIGHSTEMLNLASMYFPLVGIIVGGFNALLFYFLTFILPTPLSLLISIIATILLTGAFHEDGFSDFCDGFGGGWTKEKILEIMKDSRVGVFGVIGIVSMLGTKYATLLSIVDNLLIIYILIVGHSISRLFSNSFMLSCEYVQADQLSKAKPLATKLSKGRFFFSILFGLSPILLFNSYSILLIIIPLIPLKLYFRKYLIKWIGGYTGDCLGAMQQISEVVIYISFLIILKFNYL